MKTPSQEHEMNTAPQELDSARGLSLSRYVSVIFAVLTILLMAGRLVLNHLQLGHFSRIIVMVAVANIVSVNLYVFAYYLTAFKKGNWAGRFIILAFLISLFSVQTYRVFQYGLDPLTIASFTAELIPIGLASVLDNSAFMFLTTIIINIATAIIIFGAGGNTAKSSYFVYGAYTINVVVEWLIAMLVFMASTLYSRALREVGSLKKAYERSVQLENLKDQFITHVNHELRTPIMTMQGTMEFLGEARASLSESAQIDLIQQARRNAQRLVDLLSSILDARQVERRVSAMETEPAHALALVKAAVEIIDPLQKYGIQISGDPQVFVLGQKTAILQILTNYLSNAVKYSPSGAPIAVSVQKVTSRGHKRSRRVVEQVVFNVQDGGLGVPEDQIPLLFNRFVRLERDLASTIPGNGLGLYLSKVLAESMSGSVGVTSPAADGAGSNFWLKLPLAQVIDDEDTAPRPAVAQMIPS